MGIEEECLHRFGQHCRAFYDSSLILRASNSSLSSMQEEKKADETSNDSNDRKNNAAEGKIVLDALDRISAISSMVASAEQQPHQQIIVSLQESIGNLRHDHALVAERHHGLLMECGLLEVAQFCSQDDKEAVCLLQKYIRMRDATRRRSHKISMLHRQNVFFGLLSETDATNAHQSVSCQPHMTQLTNIQDVLSTIENFCKKYHSNIGSHPFLAGLHRIVDLQLNPKPRRKRSSRDPSYIVRWKFRGSVLTEACQSCIGNDNENADDELVYTREAIQVLFSFLVWIKDSDVEGGGWIVPVEENDFELDMFLCSSQKDIPTPEEWTEPTLSFEIDKYISNSNLRRILRVLPNPKHLDARATGSVEEIDVSPSDLENKNGAVDNNTSSRKNVDGHLDEQWPWFAQWELCNLL